MAEPIVRTVKRYVCPFCHRGRSKALYAQDHIDQCWKNPATRSCGSCPHYRPGYPASYEEPGCDPSCAIGADPFAGIDADSEYMIVRDCPSWAGEHPEQQT
jgi:hypothetical protein